MVEYNLITPNIISMRSNNKHMLNKVLKTIQFLVQVVTERQTNTEMNELIDAWTLQFT